MANPSRKKGTAGEVELMAILEQVTGRSFRRTHAGCRWDLETTDHADYGDLPPVFILATRPDRGRWLLSMTPIDWACPINGTGPVPIRVEVKRYARFALHKIYEGKTA